MLKEMQKYSISQSEMKIVLILILMEHAQRVVTVPIQCALDGVGLNPYFNGTCSKSSRVNDNASR